jgi:DNA-binding beta-propeller fold protein YncE
MRMPVCEELADAGEARGARRRLRASLWPLVALTAWSLAGAAPAPALSQRGHVPSFSFGQAGKGAGQFTSPSGIAVNDSTGHVYVVDQTNSRVEQFEPVVEGGELAGEHFVGSFEVPNADTIAVDNSPLSPSRGDVYVSGTTKKLLKEGEPEDKIVYKFSSSGTLIAKLKKFKTEKGEEAEEFEPIEGLAVDSAGDLLVYDEEAEIAEFNNAVKNKSLFSVEAEFRTPAHGLAVDSKGDLYTGLVSENAQAGGPEGEPRVVSKCEVIVVERECETLISELDQEVTTAVAVNTANVASNLVSELDDVFIANVDTIAGKKASVISAFAPGGSRAQVKLVQRFGATGLTDASGIAVDSSSGDVYVTDAASDKVYVFKLEPAGPPKIDSLSSCQASQCGPEATGVKLSAEVDPAGADTHAYFEYGPVRCPDPECTKTAAVDLHEGFGDQPLSAVLAVQEPATYHYRVVASNEHGETASAERTFTITKSLGTLPDGRAWEMVSPPNKDGFEPEPIIPQGGAIQAAADGSAIAYVADGPMPANGEPEGNRIPEEVSILSVRGSQAWGSQDLTTANTAGFGLRVGSRQEYQAFSPNLALALLQPPKGTPSTSPLAEPPLSPPQEFEVQGRKVTETQQEKSIYLRADAPIVPEPGEAGEKSYNAAKENGERMKNPGFLALVTEANALGVLGGASPGEAKFGGKIELQTATPDLSHVLFASQTAASGLYEWGANSQLQLVSVLPENKPATGTIFFGNQNNLRHAVSNSGSLVFWSKRNGLGNNLYVRDTDPEVQETLQLDKVVSGDGAGTPSANFETASADGSKVFFTDTQRLTADSKATERPAENADLYVFEIKQGKPLSGTLTDLTPAGVNGESAAVQRQPGGGGVLGASEDGSNVYFVANGALAAGDIPGNCKLAIEEPAPNRTCNLYVRHFNGTEWEAPKLVAVLSNEDAPSWSGSGFPGSDLAQLTSRVSPNGRYLAFMSNRSLTGYNNVDASPAAEGARDEEVFLYDASLERLVCASCNPTGAQPAGVFDHGDTAVPENQREGLGLVVDREGIWGPLHKKADHWLAGSVPGWTPISIEVALYQSHYLEDNGRLFFNSPDRLVPAATGTKEKVYEYEPNGLGGCHIEGGCIGLLSAPSNAGETSRERESAFLDASANGNDVFFLTAAKLLPQDVDSNFDVYDARVCEQSSGSSCLPQPELGQPPCDEVQRACKAGPSPVPSFVAPASKSVSAPGNVTGATPGSGTLPSKVTVKPKPLTRAQRLAKALKLCRSKYKKDKKRRARCEAAARKRFGHASKHKKSKKASLSARRDSTR